MTFLFDCEDAVALPAAYKLVDAAQPFIKRMAEEAKEDEDGASLVKRVIRNMMLRHPGETGELLSRLWVLEEGEKAPNVFRTMGVLFTNEVAVDFFTSVMPSLLTLSREASQNAK